MLVLLWISSGQAVSWEMWNLRNNTSNPHNNPVPKEEIPKPREPAMETDLALMLRSGAGVVVCVYVCVCPCLWAACQGPAGWHIQDRVCWKKRSRVFKEELEKRTGKPKQAE